MRSPRLILAACAAASVPLALPASSVARTDSVDRAIIRDLNRIRAAHGLAVLRLDGPLAATATNHSDAMARRNVLAHGDVRRRVGRRAHAASIGETIAWVSRRRRIASTVLAGWMHSPAHRAILLSPRFDRIGVGRHSGRNGTFVTADVASG